MASMLQEPTAPQDPFKALGPATWDISGADEEVKIRVFLSRTFNDAECVIESIPTDAPATQQTGRPRSSTDPNRQSSARRSSRPSDFARKLRKEWKEVKVNPKENPLGCSVYKLTAKDGKGSWFARRSVHEGQSFDKWKLAMQKEFVESMKVKGQPGAGSIRGIGADKRVENHSYDGCGKLEVYQLSAQFPGPTTPRDFVTMLLTTDCGLETHGTEHDDKLSRYFMVVSKPCNHPETPQQTGYIRGSYESVELIREIRTEKKHDSLRKVQSSIDLPADEAHVATRNALHGVPETDVLSTASEGGGHPHQRPPPPVEDEYETRIEWLMVTRSDPGGSVPRFMVEKGTPAGITGDAVKFINWVDRKTFQELADLAEAESKGVDTETLPESSSVEEELHMKTIKTPGATPAAKPTARVTHQPNVERKPAPEEEAAINTGFYGMLAGAIGAAATMIPTFGGYQEDTSPELSPSTDDDDDDRSSIRTFHSFAPGQDINDEPADAEVQLSRATTNGEAPSVHSSTGSTTARSTNNSSQHDKELRKLEERRRKMEERIEKSKASVISKGASNEGDLIAKLQEKHDRLVAKQTDKYQRELRKLEAKRQNEQRKAEERRRKQVEREERANLTMELEKARAERDVARKQMEVLRERVGELQTQNTLLVARLGREGITLDASITNILSGSHKGSSSPGGKLSRASTILGAPSQSSSTTAVASSNPDRPRGRSTTNLQGAV